jgi:hypothetical protein
MKRGLILTVLLTNVVAWVFSQTVLTVNNTGTWAEAVNGIRSGGNGKEYTITVTGTVSVPASNGLTFGSVTGVTVTIEGSGTLSLSNNGNLMSIGNGQTVIAKDLTLKGRDSNSGSVVTVAKGGIFCMKGKAAVTGNKADRWDGRGVPMVIRGGGVYVNGGSFVMKGGTVSGNTSASDHAYEGEGGGVFVIDKGTFTMEGGTISGNAATYGGGGVYNQYGGFAKTGGTIYGDDA